MNLPKLIAALQEAGCTPEHILAVAAKADEERRAKAREGNKRRQARYRLNHPAESNAHNAVTDRYEPLQAVIDRDERYETDAPRVRVLCGEDSIYIPQEPTVLTPTADRPKRGKRRSSLTPDQPISESQVQIADGYGIDARTRSVEWEKFVGHHRAKGNVMRDWDQAWRNWIRNGRSFGARAGPAPISTKTSKWRDAFNLGTSDAQPDESNILDLAANPAGEESPRRAGVV